MAAGTWIRRTVAAAMCVALGVGPGGPAAVFAGQRDGDRGPAYAVPRDARPSGSQPSPPGYDNGFREGQRQGTLDARENRGADFARNEVYRSGDRGYDSKLGGRDVYRTDFRRGFELGYRQGYDGGRIVRDDRRTDNNRLWARGYQEPATSRGYRDGFARGASDGRDRDRYDPVRAIEYRVGDKGYYRDYGSKDAYKNNYRTGFRQGYEDGYRDGNGSRR